MWKKTEPRGVASRRRLLVTLALGLVLAPAAPAAVTGSKDLINECNSDMTIGQTLGGMNPAGQIITVTLTVSSTDARDGADNPIGQAFDQVRYRPDCSGIFPCNLVPPAGPVTFVGVTGGTCAGMASAAPATGPACGGGAATAVVPDVAPNSLADEINFDFVPDLCLEVPAPATPISCTIIFDVAAPAGSYTSEAMTDGICLNPLDPTGTFNSSTTVTGSITIVPTMGEIALAILALILIAGSWMILRRRNTPSALVG